MTADPLGDRAGARGDADEPGPVVREILERRAAVEAFAGELRLLLACRGLDWLVRVDGAGADTYVSVAHSDGKHGWGFDPCWREEQMTPTRALKYMLDREGITAASEMDAARRGPPKGAQ